LIHALRHYLHEFDPLIHALRHYLHEFDPLIHALRHYLHGFDPAFLSGVVRFREVIFMRLRLCRVLGVIVRLTIVFCVSVAFG
jgi:hypothetical protein